MKFIILLGLFLLNIQDVFAEETCYLNNETQLVNIDVSSQYQFGNKMLICTHSNLLSLKGYNKNELKIVRAHDDEIKPYQKLASAHGYHLINQSIDCQKSHCEHMHAINLDDFKNIQKYTSKPELHKRVSQVQSLVDEINPKAWLSDIVTLSSWSRVSGSSDNNSAKTFIENRFNALNLQVSTQSFTVNSNQTHNIIGLQVGSDTPDDWYVVGAHMDSTSVSGNSPGAIDNASGCAGVMELARIVSGNTFSSSIIFICYSGEEQGLIESSFHVNSIISDGDQSKVKAALTMDMIGYTSDSDHELLIETSSSN